MTARHLVQSTAPSFKSSVFSLSAVPAYRRIMSSTAPANNGIDAAKSTLAAAASPSSTSLAPEKKQELPRFPLSAIPKFDHPVRTAACLIIGDEVLNGKTKDSNSNFLAKFLFDLAIDLKRIEVIADDEDEIVEAVTRLAARYDFVITSGGIGPTQ